MFLRYQEATENFYVLRVSGMFFSWICKTSVLFLFLIAFLFEMYGENSNWIRSFLMLSKVAQRESSFEIYVSAAMHVRADLAWL
jgi:hypothetical protein